MSKSKKSSKEAKFFCECCGSEVPRKAKTCPMCGKFFASVLCPKCGHTGTTDEFKKGCPECGYAVNNGLNNIKKKKNEPVFYDPLNPGNLNSRNGKSNGSSVNGKNGKAGYETSIPVWIYAVCITTLLILIFMLYSCL